MPTGQSDWGYPPIETPLDVMGLYQVDSWR